MPVRINVLAQLPHLLLKRRCCSGRWGGGDRGGEEEGFLVLGLKGEVAGRAFFLGGGRCRGGPVG